MSQEERDRIRVIEALEARVITQAEAARWLDLSVRQVRRVLVRYREAGDAGLVHRGRGRASKRRIDESVAERAGELLRTRYRDFGPTLACERLAADHAIAVSRETVRGWMRQQGLWAGRRVNRPHRSRRPRRACLGELVQMDTSSHDWLEGRGEACVLITMIDDATGRKLSRFYAGDSTAANMDLIGRWIERHGRPLALYTDRAGHFKQTPRRGQGGAPGVTQIERALGELDVRLIAARSPQAKGRVERSHGTDQDRLVKQLRLAGARTLEEANRFLDGVYLPQVNARFAVEPASAADAHRPAEGFDLAAILSVQESRRVANDYTVRVDGVALQIESGQIAGGLRQTRVLVERRGDGSLRLRWGDRYLKHHVARSACRIKADTATGGAGVPVGLRPPSTPAPPKPPCKPSADHPWRKGTFLLCAKADIPTLR